MMAASIDDLTSKVEVGEPLSADDIASLGATRDIILLGMLASTVRRKLHGTDVTYLRVADLGRTVSVADAGECRIFETPPTLAACVETVETAREAAGDTPLSAFCLYELSKLPEGLPVALTALNKAGLTLLTQAPIDRLTDPERMLEAVTDAGLQVARLTIHETPQRDWTVVCQDIALLQTRLGSIKAFAPLARTLDPTQPTTGYADVKRVALSRVLIDTVETIQVDWRLYGPKLAQVALTFGADDIDSVSADDDLGQGRRRSPIEEIRRSIRAAGFEPVERDGNFVHRRSAIVDRP